MDYCKRRGRCGPGGEVGICIGEGVEPPRGEDSHIGSSNLAWIQFGHWFDIGDRRLDTEPTTESRPTCGVSIQRRGRKSGHSQKQWTCSNLRRTFTCNLGQILQILLRQKSEYGDRGLKSSLGAERRMGRVPAMDYCCGSLVTRCTASDLSGRLPVLAVGVLRPHTRANPSVVNAGRGWSWALSVLEPNALTLIAGLILAALSLQGINSPDPLGWVYRYKGNGYICNWW